jgi:ATP-dependent Lon protease, bacterial type
VDPDFFSTQDIHIHIPAGAVSKDGPSAGLTIAVALVSLLTGRAARADAALSGEISLSGRVLRVAGVREKLLAAVRGGVRQVILPAENAADVELLRRSTPGLPEIILARDIGEALVSALEQGVSS